MTRILASLIWVLLALPCQAAVTLDACGTELQSSSAVTTFDYVGETVGSGLTNSGLVLLFTVVNGGSISAVTATWDTAGGTPTNQAMTALGNANNGVAAEVYFFGVRNPTAGNKTLNISWTTNAQVEVIACSWQGLDTTSDATAFKNFNSSSGVNLSTQSVTITSTANDAVMAGHNGVPTAYSSVNNTSLFIDNTGATFASAGNRVTGGVNPSMTASYTGTFTTVSAGISIAAPGGAGATASTATSTTLTGAGR